jgi:MYXO-CTERM domain-containing protein
MKRTIIALMALAGVAAAEDWTATFTSKNQTINQTGTDYSAIFSAGTPLTLDITGLTLQNTGKDQGNGTYGKDTNGVGNASPSSIRPNVNIGNGGSYTLSFILTNTSQADINLTSLSVNTFTYGSAGNFHQNVDRPITLTLLGGLTGSSNKTMSSPNIPNTDNTTPILLTLNEPVLIKGEKELSFNLTITENNSGGTFVGLKGATFSGEIVTPVIPDTPAVPEPTTATLSLLALAGLAARRRRR